MISHILPTAHFEFRKVTVERPLRINFQATPESILRVEDERGFQALAKSKKRGYAANQEEERGRRLQDSLRKMLNALPETVIKDRKDFEDILDDASKRAEIKLSAPVRRTILNALAERDETAAICKGRTASRRWTRNFGKQSASHCPRMLTPTSSVKSNPM